MPTKTKLVGGTPLSDTQIPRILNLLAYYQSRVNDIEKDIYKILLYFLNDKLEANVPYEMYRPTKTLKLSTIDYKKKVMLFLSFDILNAQWSNPILQNMIRLLSPTPTTECITEFTNKLAQNIVEVFKTQTEHGEDTLFLPPNNYVFTPTPTPTPQATSTPFPSQTKTPPQQQRSRYEYQYHEQPSSPSAYPLPATVLANLRKMYSDIVLGSLNHRMDLRWYLQYKTFEMLARAGFAVPPPKEDHPSQMLSHLNEYLRIVKQCRYSENRSVDDVVNNLCEAIGLVILVVRCAVYGTDTFALPYNNVHSMFTKPSACVGLLIPFTVWLFRVSPTDDASSIPLETLHSLIAHRDGFRKHVLGLSAYVQGAPVLSIPANHVETTLHAISDLKSHALDLDAQAIFIPVGLFYIFKALTFSWLNHEDNNYFESMNASKLRLLQHVLNLAPPARTGPREAILSVVENVINKLMTSKLSHTQYLETMRSTYRNYTAQIASVLAAFQSTFGSLTFTRGPF